MGNSNSGARPSTLDDFRTKLKAKHGDRIKVKEYTKAFSPTDFKCMVCGNIWTTCPVNVLNSKVGCPKCGRAQAASKTRMTNAEYAERLSKNSKGRVTNIEKYVGDAIPIKHRCSCGHTFIKRPQHMRGLKRPGCPACIKSHKGNYSVSAVKWLDSIQKKTAKFSIQHAKNGGEKRLVLSGKLFKLMDSVQKQTPCLNT